MMCGSIFSAQTDETCAVESYASYQLIDHYIHDFGDVAIAGGPVSATFHVLSSGSSPMIVLSGSTTCVCTQVSQSQDIIYPGDTLQVVVTYNPFVAGTFKQSAVLSTNTYPYNYIRVYVKGNVIESDDKNENNIQR